jgi:tripartite-type tricarboxylate transporter receptor subunit TctC
VGQPVVAERIGFGAGGAIAAQAGSAPPMNGYTWLVAPNNAHVICSDLFQAIRKQTSRLWHYSITSNLLVVNPECSAHPSRS